MARTARIRELAASLNSRGRAFLLTGGLAAIMAQLLGERDLLRVGALLAALPLVSLAVVGRTRFRLRLVRTVAPDRVPAGHSARVTLRLENVSRLPSATLLMEDTLPYSLGGRPRFVLQRVESGGVREATYTVRCANRGKYLVGPLTVRLSDPFGCVEMSRSFTSTEALIVTPVISPLPAIAFGGDWQGAGEGRSMRAAVTGEADVAIREYRHGDDLRRIHWRATAKAGDLMVRRDEQPRHDRATLILDTRRHAHRGDGPSSSFEWSVSAAASIGVWLTGRGYALRLTTTDGVDTEGASPGLAESLLLDALSIISLGNQRGVDEATHRVHGHGGNGVIVAILGILDETAIETLAGMPAATSTAVAVLVDAANWTGTTPRSRDRSEAALERARSSLAAAGWQVVVARAGEPLAALWPAAGRRRGAAFTTFTTPEEARTRA